jgi:hypothetical protein
MHLCVEQSNGVVPLSLFPSWQGCITNTSGYDFRKGQAITGGADDILVMFGGTPLVRSETLLKLRAALADGAAGG